MEKIRKPNLHFIAIFVGMCGIMPTILLHSGVIQNAHAVMLVTFAKTLMSITFNALFIYLILSIIINTDIIPYSRYVSISIAAAAALLIPFINTSYTCKIKSSTVLPCTMLAMQAADIFEEPVAISATGGRAYKSSISTGRRGEYSSYFFEYTYNDKVFAMPVTINFYNKAKYYGLSGNEDIELLVYPHSGIAADFAKAVIGRHMLPDKAAELLKREYGLPYTLTCEDNSIIKFTKNAAYKSEYFDNPLIKANCVTYYKIGMSANCVRQIGLSSERKYDISGFSDGAYYAVLTARGFDEVRNRLYYEVENGEVHIVP